MQYQFRPIDTWPGVLRTQRSGSPFKAPYSSTLELVARELEHLEASLIVIELAMRPQDIRKDGMPRSSAPMPAHPGVILSFDSKHGPLRYFTDVYDNAVWRRTAHEGWKANLRAIGLGLEALRKVDRYGITKRGEQYTGWKELSSGIPMDEGMTEDEAIAILHAVTDEAGDPGWDYDNPEEVKLAFKVAAKRVHPDVGGDPDEFFRITQAKNYLVERYS